MSSPFLLPKWNEIACRSHVLSAQTEQNSVPIAKSARIPSNVPKNIFLEIRLDKNVAACYTACVVDDHYFSSRRGGADKGC